MHAPAGDRRPSPSEPARDKAETRPTLRTLAVHHRLLPPVRLPLRSRRLALRPPRRADVPILVRELEDRRIYENVARIPYPYRARDGYEWVRRTERSRLRGDRLGLLIVRAKDAAVMGGISISPDGDDAATLIIGYWLGQSYRGQGFATEAVTTIVRAA
ncbi:MAG: GNAT family N-acetyltransferase, partial [Thermoplasmata archaeon]|nr:GNAT family N-acetyltransferase [Thermoplasmata archaeon]